MWRFQSTKLRPTRVAADEAFGWRHTTAQTGAVVFAIGAMGGGDVKLIAAIALWLPWQLVVLLLVIMSLAGGLLTVAMLIHKRLARRETPIEVPYGVAIAFGGLWLIAQRFLYQFV